jgi:NOL1/NOP2/sun family putative RNA methylase
MTKRLPQDFLQARKPLLGDEWEAFLQSYEEPRSYGLRCNPLKEEGELPFSLEPVPWTSHGYYVSPEEHPGRHPLHEAGAYYIQEPSAMAVVSLLDPKPNEIICDLCAAPGGKSTQIAGLMGGQGLLVSNEIFPARAKILSQNIERLGISNALVCNEPPERMAAHFPLFFDRIVVDAPCSGEGMFRKDDTAIQEWSLDNIALCVKRQKMILDCAHEMLHSGGTLVYSTCTFSPEENEEMILWFLKNHPEYSLIDWKTTALGKQVSACAGNAGLRDGFACPGTLRLWPHLLRGEGHFMARLQKNGDDNAPKKKIKKTKRQPALLAAEKWYQEFAELYLSPAQENTPPVRFQLFGEELYQIPDSAPNLAGIKLVRAGLHLGTLKKNRFEPSHALAKTLAPEQSRQYVLCDDATALCYLKGESIPCDSSLKGWTLVCYETYPLGWGKAQNGMLKNHFPKGLRWQGTNFR